MKERSKVIDLIRGVAIILVLWGHAIQYTSLGMFECLDNTVYRAIYGCHMALFMSVSGFLFYNSFNKYQFPSIIKKNLNILRPILIWNSIFFVTRIPDIVKNMGGGYNQILIECMAQLWFLWSVLFCSMAMTFVLRFTHGHFQRGIGIVFGMVLLAFIPFHRSRNLWMFPYFVGGFLFNQFIVHFQSGEKHCRKTRNFKVIGIASIIFYFILLHFFDNRYYVYSSGFSGLTKEIGIISQLFVILYRWILGFIGVAAIIIVCYFVGERYDFRLLQVSGKYSLQIYVLQSFILERLFGKAYRTLHDITDVSLPYSNPFLYDIFTLLIALSILLLCLMITWIINKLKMSHFLFGR